ncbi:hypothetical protein PCASD_02246 [Puccinia coronata f. sp. avenae]|uniref:Uncharacterized protein n=1 Tax=Puccinia coronata f. sp. avenae TaxID=200324 RepID=A0A2N5T0W1_9BASI|nr:hypothetical protein PCASD_14049 [Puccinia coronata f. sp. avenae]PLW49620.1 hypothetical protein PCASD_02246 [Puccinia coronata f. sp. avenae]
MGGTIPPSELAATPGYQALQLEGLVLSSPAESVPRGRWALRARSAREASSSPTCQIPAWAHAAAVASEVTKLPGALPAKLARMAASELILDMAIRFGLGRRATNDSLGGTAPKLESDGRIRS